MSAIDLLAVLTQIFFIFLGVVTLLAFIRYRDQNRKDIALMFGTLAVPFVAQLLERFTSYRSPLFNTIGTIALLAQPFLLLRLVGYFRPIHPLVKRIALIGMVVAWGAFIVLSSLTQAAATVVFLAIIAYFAAVDGYAMVALVQSALKASGVVRQRLRFAAAGSGLLALALVNLGFMLIIPSLIQLWTVIVLVTAIASACCYYVGFATPRWLRRAWQLGELRRFLVTISRKPIGDRLDVTRALDELCQEANRAVGGVAAAIARDGERDSSWVLRHITGSTNLLNRTHEGAGMLRSVSQSKSHGYFRMNGALVEEDRRLLSAIGAETVIIAPISAAERTWGLLLVFMNHDSLFIDDDVELVSFLAQQNAIFLANSVLVSELNDYSEGLERKIEERTHELEKSREEYRRIIETAQEGIWVTDQNNKTTFVNPRMSELLGYSIEEIISQPFGTFVSEIGDELLAAYRERRRQGVREQYDLKLRRKDGSVLDTLASVTPLLDGDNQYIGSLAMIADITERKRAEAQIMQLNAELEQRVAERTSQLIAVNRELEAFSYSVSHDLRAPLRALDGFSLALLEDYGDHLDQDGRNFLERIRAGSQRMAQLIDALLQLSRLTRTELQIRPVNLSEMVRSIVSELQETQPDKPTEFQIQEGLQANGDERLLRAALTNLINNAWKFSRTQERPCIEFGSAEKDGRQVYYVRDNGVGFDMAYVNKLFGAFQRLHSATEFEGTGIGLATVERIMHRHGGQIWAEAAVNQGAAFYFTL